MNGLNYLVILHFIRVSCLLCVFITGCLNSPAQDKCINKIFISGIIYGSDSQKVLSDVRIEISGKNQMFFSNMQGYFSCCLERNDTLLFLMTGYKRQRYNLLNASSVKTEFIRVILTEDTLMLPEAVIFNMPGTFQELKTQFCDMKIENKTQKKIIIPGAIQKDGPFETVRPDPFQNPVTFLYENFNRNARFERKKEKARGILKDQLKKNHGLVIDSLNNFELINNQQEKSK